MYPDSDVSNTVSADETVQTSTLIIGAGAAGARLGIELAQEDEDCLVVSKRDHGDAHTTWAAGGINASLGNLDPEDSWEIHVADTLKEGHFINTPETVEVVARNMPDRIHELESWGCNFDKTSDNKIDQRYFGAQSYRRTCYVGDKTGRAILETLVEKAQSEGVPYRDNLMITKLLSDDEQVYGAVGFDMETGNFILFNVDRIVLAAGGYSAVYNRHSSRDLENNGDGIALGYDAGAKLENIEFVQFHPTGIVAPGSSWDGRLITEAVRGEGGKLFNADGERFMKKYSPDKMELDARDVVARAIVSEIEDGNGTENGGVYLDISHRDETYIEEKLPRMYERCLELGVNLSKEPIEIAPTAHYSMGGIKMDPQTGQTTVDSLYAIGETAAGVHGANRLGGNSLAETVALGKKVGEHIASNAESRPTGLPEEQQEEAKRHFTFLEHVASGNGDQDPGSIALDIREIAEVHTGIRRNQSSLEKGRNKLNDLHNRLFDVDVDEVTSVAFEEAIDNVFMYLTTRLIIEGATARKESRGAHYRSDYPEKEPSYRKKTTYNPTDETVTFESVQAEPSQSVQQALDEGHELSYHHLE